jgi:hypothetical protein
VYVAPLTAANADAATVSLIQDRVLVATRRHAALFQAVSNSEMRALLDAEALRAALACDTTGCEAEIADALSAPQLITGQIGRIGSTWQITLTRTDRETLYVLARATREGRGDTAEALLPLIDELVDELLGIEAPPPSWPGIAGWLGVGTGAVALAAGGGIYAFSWLKYFDAKDALQRDEVKAAQEARSVGEAALVPAWIVGAAGGVLVAVGIGLLVVDGGGGE